MRDPFLDDGTITSFKKKNLIRRKVMKKQSKSSPLTNKDLDSLVDRIANKLKGLISSEEIKGTGKQNLDTSDDTLVQIDETLIDMGVDITNLESSEQIEVKEEEKVDDLQESKRKLSRLLGGK